MLMVSRKQDKVIKLIKALHGLKQTSKAEHNKIDGYTNQGFKISKNKPTLFIKSHDEYILNVFFYVNNFIYIGNNAKMMKMFEMTNLNLIHYFLGIKIIKEKFGIFMSQKTYIES